MSTSGGKTVRVRDLPNRKGSSESLGHHPQQVTFGHDTDEPRVLHDRQRAHLLSHDGPGGFGYIGIGTACDDLPDVGDRVTKA